MPQPPNEALGDTLEARDPQNGHLGRPNGPLERTLGAQDLQNGALEVPLRSLLAPKMFKFDLLGSLWEPKLSFWSLVGAP